MNDAGEPAKNGSLLVAKYGEGFACIRVTEENSEVRILKLFASILGKLNFPNKITSADFEGGAGERCFEILNFK